MRTLQALGLLLLILVSSCSSGSDRIPAELTGSWIGDGRVIVNWCDAERIDIALEIDQDGSVNGRVGDARLINGQLGPNRGGVGRTLNVKTDWIVTADLEGQLIDAEDIQREGVKLPLNLVEGELRGGLHSTGSHLGGKDTMVFTAADVVLKAHR